MGDRDIAISRAAGFLFFTGILHAFFPAHLKYVSTPSGICPWIGCRLAVHGCRGSVRPPRCPCSFSCYLVLEIRWILAAPWSECFGDLRSSF
jgi:hypothetical protein